MLQFNLVRNISVGDALSWCERRARAHSRTHKRIVTETINFPNRNVSMSVLAAIKSCTQFPCTFNVSFGYFFFWYLEKPIVEPCTSSTRCRRKKKNKKINEFAGFVLFPIRAERNHTHIRIKVKRWIPLHSYGVFSTHFLLLFFLHFQGYL